MNLKESYRYANFLDHLLITAYSYLCNKDFVTTTTEEHLRSKVNPDAENEIVKIQKPNDVEFTPNQVIDLVVNIIDEKEKLSDAISKAKSGTEIDIDNAIAMNKKKQKFIGVLNSLANIKPKERQKNGSDYKFNTDGNQVSYYYTINETTTIDFDRNDVRKLAKKYLKETDEISAKLDAIEINTVLNFTPKYDVNSTFEECVEM